MNGEGRCIPVRTGDGDGDAGEPEHGEVDDDGQRVLRAAALSADGRYRLFVSVASDLTGTDTTGRTDVFMFDRVTRRSRW